MSNPGPCPPVDQLARRDLLRFAGALAAVGSGLCGARQALAAMADNAEGAGHGHQHILSPETKGVLVDLTDCVGCRLCEYACKKANGIEPGALESYDDQSVFHQRRRPENRAFTVINAYTPPATQPDGEPARPVYAKVNCMHCNYAACVSACIVGALQKQESGAVTYDAWKCIGCRYCMVACPFQIPTYEYENVLTPQVRKCTLCEHRTSHGELPGCVKECPRQALTYGKRADLLALAHRKIAEHPGRYVDHVYGEHEVGGTSWIYLSAVPFEQAGFQSLGDAAPPALTEAIQHGVFKHWITPIGWYGFLATASWLTSRRARLAGRAREHRATADALPGGADIASPSPDTPGEGRGEGDLGEAAPPDRNHPHPNPLPQYRERGSEHPKKGPDHHSTAAPMPRKLLTPGVWVLIAMVLIGVAFGLYRFIFGLAASTNLDQQHPWGLWIAMDVGSGIALAGGGFVTAALVHIFHREHYHAIARSALLTALLGYTFYVPGLLADLGRWYNLWHPTLPMMWQGNSVLFEVGICVMIYLNVQYAEIMPIICERFLSDPHRHGRLARIAKFVHDTLERIMPAFLVAGVTLSTFHQSSLGNLMVIAPYKLHPLWWSPMSPLLFLLSAMMVGFPMVIFTILFASWSLRRRPEMNVLAPLSIYVVVFLIVYLGVKAGDMAVRGTYSKLGHVSPQSTAWIVEMIAGVLVPLALLLSSKVRRSPFGLGVACLMIILGVVLNRLNVFIIGYHPPFATRTYVPSICEIAVSLGLVAALMLMYRVAVTYLPILEPIANDHTFVRTYEHFRAFEPVQKETES